MSKNLQIQVKAAPKSMFLLISSTDQPETKDCLDEAKNIADQIVLRKVESPHLSICMGGSETKDHLVYLAIYLEDGHGIDGFSYGLPLIFQFTLEKLGAIRRSELRSFLTSVARSKKELVDKLLGYFDKHILSLLLQPSVTF